MFTLNWAIFWALAIIFFFFSFCLQLGFPLWGAPLFVPLFPPLALTLEDKRTRL